MSMFVDSSIAAGDEHAPDFVTVVPLMVDHVKVVLNKSMLNLHQPTLLLKRGSTRFEAMYIFGDASGMGFGSSSWTEGDGVKYRYGVWGES